MGDGANHAADLRSVIVDRRTTGATKAERLNGALLRLFFVNRAFDLCHFKSGHDNILSFALGLFAEGHFLLARAQQFEAVHGRFHDVIRIAAAEHFGQDILNADRFQNGTGGAAGDHAGTG